MEEGESGGEGEALPQLVSPPLNNHNSLRELFTFFQIFFVKMIFKQPIVFSATDVTTSQQQLFSNTASIS